MEKDERFWLATALMSLYHADGGSGRGELFARLLERAGLRPPAGFPRWEDALAGALDLFFEVNLPSPGRYRAWLRDHLGERAPIPYLKDQAQARGARLEGATRADAMLLAPATGVAVIFEAKVLSDISTHVTFDLARNQLARSIDVMLEVNSALAAPLSLRKPERTFLVLLTPALTQPGRAGDAISKSRLYGWLMPAYKDPDSSLLRQHLPHRDGSELAGAAERLGGRAGKTATPWLRVPARGLQPPRAPGDDATKFDPIHPTPPRRPGAAGLLTARCAHGHQTRYAAVGCHHGPHLIQPTR